MIVIFVFVLQGLQSLGDLYSYDVLAYYCALVTQSSGWPSLSPTLVASLPSITVSSSQFKDEYKDPLVLSSVVQSDKPVPSCTLPWSVTCEKFSIYTLHPSEHSADTAARTVLGSKLLYLVEPLSLDIVIAPSSGLGKTSELSGGGYMMSFGREVTVCCHMSVGTVLLAISRKQVWCGQMSVNDSLLFCLSICLSVCLFVSLFVVHFFVYLFICLFICLCGQCVCVCVCVCVLLIICCFRFK